MKQALIIGLGKFGGTLAKELAGKNCEVAVIESDRQKVEVVKDVVSQSIVADATEIEVLKQYGKDVDFAVVSVGEKVDTSILIVYYLKEIGVKRIIAKATSVAHGEILKLIGAHEVIFPQRDIAKRLANSLLSPSLIDIINLSDEFDIVELATPNEFINHSIKELHLNDKYGIQVLVIKNPLTGQMNIMPPTEYKLKADDIIYALGKYESFKQFQKS